MRAPTHAELRRFKSNFGVEKENGCIPWRGYFNGGGYPDFFFDRHHRQASHFLWEWKKGPIPPGLWVLHTCDNNWCIQLDHFYLGTHQDNMLDVRERKRHKINRKVTDSEVLEILASRNSMTYVEIAAKYGISKNHVWRILSGEQRKPFRRP